MNVHVGDEVLALLRPGGEQFVQTQSVRLAEIAVLQAIEQVVQFGKPGGIGAHGSSSLARSSLAAISWLMQSQRACRIRPSDFGTELAGRPSRWAMSLTVAPRA